MITLKPYFNAARVGHATVLASLSLLAACSGTGSHFGCSATAGVACTPVAMVNAQADAGYFDHPYHMPTAGLPAAHRVDTRDHRQQVRRVASFRRFRLPLHQTSPPHPHRASALRLPEQLQRVWIAPYVDETSCYHSGHGVTMVRKPARWRMPQQKSSEPLTPGKAHHPDTKVAE